VSHNRWDIVWGPPQRPGNRPSVSIILPELLVGEYPTPRDAAWLRQVHGVTAVVSLQDDPDLAGKGLRLRDLERAYRESGVEFHRLPIADGDSDMLLARLDGAVELLHASIGAGHCVFLHCNAGMNRAPTIAIAYLHVHRGLALEKAREFLKTRRPCVPYMTVLAAHYAPAEPQP
jgi:atypical dual specificity phosphatase